MVEGGKSDMVFLRGPREWGFKSSPITFTGCLLCVGTKLSSTSIIPLNSYDNHDIVSILWTRKVRSRVVE